MSIEKQINNFDFDEEWLEPTDIDEIIYDLDAYAEFVKNEKNTKDNL